MKAQLIFRKMLCAVCLSLPSVAVIADAAAPMSPAGDEALTMKQRLIKWTLTDNKFVEKAVLASRAEIELSKLAVEKSQSSQVLGFAKAMVKDHTAADTKLSAIAQRQNFPLPQKLDDDHSSDVQRLKNLSGPQFDAAYIDLMQKDHEKAVSLFKAAADDEGLNLELRQFAQETLPTLRLHKEHAQSLPGENAASIK